MKITDWSHAQRKAIQILFKAISINITHTVSLSHSQPSQDIPAGHAVPYHGAQSFAIASRRAYGWIGHLLLLCIHVRGSCISSSGILIYIPDAHVLSDSMESLWHRHTSTWWTAKKTRYGWRRGLWFYGQHCFILASMNWHQPYVSLLETLHTAFAMRLLYYYTVLSFGRLDMVLVIYWYDAACYLFICIN